MRATIVTDVRPISSHDEAVETERLGEDAEDTHAQKGRGLFAWREA